jgi:hypothetical protein
LEVGHHLLDARVSACITIALKAIQRTLLYAKYVQAALNTSTAAKASNCGGPTLKITSIMKIAAAVLRPSTVAGKMASIHFRAANKK